MAKLTNINTHGKVTGQVSTCIAVIIRLIMAKGKRNFQANAISWSILIRGSVVRIQTMAKNTAPTLIRNQSHGGNTGPLQPPRKRVVIIAEIAKASAYSTK